MLDYDFSHDFIFVRSALGLTQIQLANQLKVTNVSLSHYESGKSKPRLSVVERLYKFAFDNGMDLNLLKTRFLEDDASGRKLLFHGSRDGIKGEVDLAHGNPKSDFGMGFYAGETLQQGATWVSQYEKGSVYCFYFDERGLKTLRYDVGRDWMLAVCLFRGYLKDKEDHPLLKNLKKEIDKADYIVAPIVDNVMYETLHEFSEGMLTDEQALHALSANHLGYQYVFKTESSIKAIVPAARLYLCEEERRKYEAVKETERHNGVSKLRISRVEYQNKGSYIDGIFS